MKITAIAIAVLILSIETASSCSCYTPAGPDEMPLIYADRASAVFEGYVIALEVLDPADNPLVPEVHRGQPYVRATIRVAFVWKGEVEPEVSVLTPLGQEACGAEFQVGACALVFALARDETWLVDRCSGTWRGWPNGTFKLALGEPERVLQDVPCIVSGRTNAGEKVN